MYNLYFINSYAIINGKVTRKALNLRAGDYDLVLFDKFAKSMPIAMQLHAGEKVKADNADVIRIDKQSYYVCPHCRFISGETNVIRQKQLGKYMITIYDNGEKSLLIESEEYFYNTYVRDEDLHFSLISSTGTLVCVRGEKILIILDEKLDLIYMNQYVDYTLNDDGFVTEAQINGIVNRKITETYEYSGELKSRTVDYLEGSVFIEELRAHVFMEAMLCGDYVFAREMLSDDLRESIEELAMFLGEPIEMIIDDELPFNADKVLLRYVDGYKLYQLAIENDRIANIAEI